MCDGGSCCIFYMFICFFCLAIHFYFFVFFSLIFISIVHVIFFFFFSSRRRHTRYIGDWSSDVCSSDLEDARGDQVDVQPIQGEDEGEVRGRRNGRCRGTQDRPRQKEPGGRRAGAEADRSEERRVGKECRARWWPDQ